MLVVSGEGVFEIDGEEYPATVGRLFFTSPLQRHSFFNVGLSQVRYAEINFELLPEGGPPTLELPFEKMLAAWTGQRCRYVMDLDAPTEFAQTFLAAIEDLAGADGGSASVSPSDIETSQALSRVLQAAYEHVFRVQCKEPSNRLDETRAFIHNHFREELSLIDLARRAALEPKYFSRRFKKSYGRSPIDYQIELRVRHACELLRTADRTLAQVAESVGMRDVYYFSRVFSRRMGVSPGRYRRTLQTERATPVTSGDTIQATTY